MAALGKTWLEAGGVIQRLPLSPGRIALQYTQKNLLTHTFKYLLSMNKIPSTVLG